MLARRFSNTKGTMIMLASLFGHVLFTALQGGLALGVLLFLYSMYRDVAGFLSDKDVR
jgi:hypothetical protein